MTSPADTGGRVELLALAERCEAATSAWTPESLTAEAIDEFCAAIGAVKGDPVSKGWRVRIQLISALQGSLDAALALVAEKLPGCEYELTNLYGVASATLPLNFSDLAYSTGRNEANIMPCAVLSALLRALAADTKEQADG